MVGAGMYDLLRDRIERGVYLPDQRLPSERKLAAELRVPQSRIRKALQALVEAGYLNCLRNSGYFVRKHQPSQTVLHNIAFCSNMAQHEGTREENFYTGLLFNRAASFGLNLLAYPLPAETRRQNELFFELLSNDVAGVICFPHAMSATFPALWELKKQGIPLIFWDYSPFHGIFPAVGVDHFQSCFAAAGVLAKCRQPVTYVGFKGKEQNELKYAGFVEGCRAFGVETHKPILIPYEKHSAAELIYQHLKGLTPGKLIFASTRLLTETVVGRMMDHGWMPGRDYRLLGTDMVQILKGSSLTLDCMMRERTLIIDTLLSTMKDTLETFGPTCCDYRIAMKYLPGDSLTTS
jgi:DNA-binding GntR family transcriptional regulator